MLRRPRENRVSSWLHLKQNTDRPQRKRSLLRSPPKKRTIKKTSTTNQERALTAGTRAGLPENLSRAFAARSRDALLTAVLGLIGGESTGDCSLGVKRTSQAWLPLALNGT